ncbi:MAG: hypothetical protein IPM25_20190 [Chloracidobacterium sp.]|nr:hypothetical protein [Chloracidobacterium sp.]
MTSAVKALDEAAAEAGTDRARGGADQGVDRCREFLSRQRNGTTALSKLLDKAREYAERLDNVHRDGFLGQTSVGLLRAGSIELADRMHSRRRGRQDRNVIGPARVFARIPEQG